MNILILIIIIVITLSFIIIIMLSNLPIKGGGGGYLANLEKKFGKDKIITFSDFPNIVYFFPFTQDVEKLQITVEGLYSTSSPSVMHIIMNIIKDELNIYNLSNLVITDATANVGGSAINFAFQAKYVNAVEIDKKTFDILQNNIDVFNLRNKMTLYNEDYTKIMMDLVQDVIFIDPPWGGDYL